MAKHKQLNRILAHLVLLLGAAAMILPFVWMVLTSFKSVTESTSMNPFIFFPKTWRVENYLEVWRQNNFLILYWNTFAMMALRVLCAVMFSAMAAYAFARLRFPGRDFCFSLVLFQMMVPTQIFIIPQYLMVDALGMRNTIFALLFPGLVSAFGTFLLRQFFMGLPKEPGGGGEDRRLQYRPDLRQNHAPAGPLRSGGPRDIHGPLLLQGPDVADDCQHKLGRGDPLLGPG